MCLDYADHVFIVFFRIRTHQRFCFLYHSTFSSRLCNNTEPLSFVDHSISLLLIWGSIGSLAPMDCGPTLYEPGLTHT